VVTAPALFRVAENAGLGLGRRQVPCLRRRPSIGIVGLPTLLLIAALATRGAAGSAIGGTRHDQQSSLPFGSRDGRAADVRTHLIAEEIRSRLRGMPRPRQIGLWDSTSRRRAHGHERNTCAGFRDAFRSKMPKEEIVEGQRLVLSWLPSIFVSAASRRLLNSPSPNNSHRCNGGDNFRSQDRYARQRWD
jgi:hypothetical protein